MTDEQMINEYIETVGITLCEEDPALNKARNLGRFDRNNRRVSSNPQSVKVRRHLAVKDINPDDIDYHSSHLQGCHIKPMHYEVTMGAAYPSHIWNDNNIVQKYMRGE